MNPSNGRRGLQAVAFAACLVACSSSGDPGEGGGGSPETPAPSGSADTRSDAGGGGTDGGGGGADAGGSVAATCDGDEGGPVPTTPAELQAWLITKKYTCWARESVKHPSTGPHGGDVRTYLNASLDASMKSKAAEHPRGAVAVKELYGSGSVVTGWAVGVKTQDASAAGAGWYWYEAFGTTPGASTIEGQNKPLCTNCHAAGRDFVLVPFPLR